MYVSSKRRLLTQGAYAQEKQRILAKPPYCRAVGALDVVDIDLSLWLTARLGFMRQQ